MPEDFTEIVVEMYRNNDWESILNLNIDTSNERAHHLLWVWPSKENLLFIKKSAEKFDLKGVLSIGCGTGLFEWLLYKYTNVPVIGLEVDRSWWTSKYSKYKFISLNYISMPPDARSIRPDYALLFCYFNNGPAFREYIRCYSGNMVIVIGPGKGRNTLTNPEPFNPNFESSDWKLLDYQEVKNSKDFIAIYIR